MTDETNPGKVLGKSSQMAIQLTKQENKEEQKYSALQPTQSKSTLTILTSFVHVY